MSTDLREALAGLAREARPAGDPSSAVVAARARQRREWLLAVPAVAVVALVVVALFAVVSAGRSVQPADGPGSLPDRIYPAPSRMLTLEQSPIGRIGMLYAQPVVNGVSSWIAVGADTDTYRWVASADNSPDTVSLSADGSVLVRGETQGSNVSCALQVVDPANGAARRIVPPDVPLGCGIDVVAVSPDGGVVLTQVAEVTQRNGGDWSSRMSWWAVDLTTGEQQTVDAGGGHQLVGWIGGDPVFEGDDSSVKRSQRFGLTPLALYTVTDQGFGPSRSFGQLRHLVDVTSASSLSPDGHLLASVVDPTPSSSYPVERRVLRIWDVRRDRLVREVALGPNVDSSVRVVGWRDESTPVLGQVPVARDAGGDPTVGPDGGLFAYPAAGPVQRLISAPRSTTFLTAVVAQDPLQAPVRAAQPPHDPWYDPRLLGPTLWGAVRTPLTLLLVAALAIGAWVVVLRYTRRRLT